MKIIIIAISSFLLAIQVQAQPTNLEWARGMGGALADVATSIATDVNGNVYSSGYFSGTVDLDPSLNTYSVTSNGGIDFYISKLDALGNFVWAKTIGGTNNDFAYGLAMYPPSLSN